jgi:hypothetical protein
MYSELGVGWCSYDASTLLEAGFPLLMPFESLAAAEKSVMGEASGIKAPMRFELMSSCLPDRRFNQLSHGAGQ